MNVVREIIVIARVARKIALSFPTIKMLLGIIRARLTRVLYDL